MSLPVQRKAIELLSEHHSLFKVDVERCDQELKKAVGCGRFLVIGGAGSIGRAVVKELFKRGPAALHVVDLMKIILLSLFAIYEVRGIFQWRFPYLCAGCGLACL